MGEGFSKINIKLTALTTRRPTVTFTKGDKKDRLEAANQELLCLCPHPLGTSERTVNVFP